MKILRYLGVFFLLTLVVIIAAVFFLLATPTGLNGLLALAERVLPPDALTYERIEGRLFGPLTIDNLRFQAGELKVNLDNAEFDWTPSALFTGRLQVDTLHVNGLTLHLPEPEETERPPAEPLNLDQIPLPLQVAINDVALTDVRIWPHGAEEPVIIDSAKLQADTQGRTLHVRTLTASAPQGEVALTGQLELADDNALETDLQGTFNHPEYGPLTLQADADGALQETLNIQIDVAGAVEAGVDGEARQVLSEPGWSGELNLTIPNLGQFVPELAERTLTAQLQTQGTLDDFQAQGKLDTALPELGAVQAGFDLTGSTQAIRLSEFKVSAADNPLTLDLQADVDLDKLSVDASGQWQALAWPLVGPPQIKSPTGRFTVQGNPQDYRLELETDLAGPQLGNLQARIQAHGNDQSAELTELSIRDPGGELMLETTGQVQFSDLAFQANGRWQALAWPLTGEPQIASPQGEFSASGTPKDYQAKLTADLTSTQSGRLQAVLQASGDDKAVNLSQLSLHAPDGNLSLQVQGEVTLADQAFQASGEWRALAWPLVGEPQVQSPTGSFEASGNVKDYRFELTTQAQGPDIPQSNWTLTGEGSDQALQQLTVEGELLEGELNADISAAWQPAVSWQAELTGSDLNPGVQWPDLPGRLALQLQSQGELKDGTVQATAQLDDLSGVLRDQEVQGQAAVAVQNQDLTIDALQLSVGGARLNAAGKLEQSWDLNWQLQAADLSRLLPTLAGSIDGSGEIQGPREKPRADLDLTIQDFAVGDIALRQLQADATIDVSGDTRSQLRVTGEDLQLAGQTWSTLQLEGSGTPAEHGLQGNLAGDPGRFELALAGSLDETMQSWQGQITRLTAQETPAGDWRLEQPLSLELSAQAANAESSCLVSTPTRICFQGSWSATDGATGRVELDRLEPARFSAFLPEDLQIDTALDGIAEIQTGTDGSVQGQANLQLEPGRVTLGAGNTVLTITLAGGELLRAESDGNNASAQLDLGLGNLGQVQANARIADLPGQPRLDGTVNANITSLELLAKLVPQIQNPTGAVTADLDLAGTLAAPIIAGSVRLENAGLDIPEFDVKITDLQFAAEGDSQNALRLSGSARSGPGDLRISGRLQPADFQLELNVQGENFQLANSPEIQILLSPDINLAVDQKQVQVNGEIKIPQAFLSPPNGGGGGGAGTGNRISRSPDAVIITEADGDVPAERAAGTAISASIRVILGDVRVSAFDFNGQLTGNLLVEQTPQLAPRGTGTIGVERGEYIISGQRLEIERGRVLFSNSPLDNPGLDLRVTRTIDNFNARTQAEKKIEVGAQVIGTLKNPRFNLFSDPPLPQSTILSYLFIGRAPESAEQASFVIGRYLSPQLYVGYGVGMFDAVSTFILRYNLTENIDIEASSSSQQSGADVFYTLEN